MADLDNAIQNIWGSDYVQKNPNKAYKVTYAAEYLSVADYINGGTRPDPTNYSKLGKGLVEAEDVKRSLVIVPPPPFVSNMLLASQTILDPTEIAAWNIFDSPTTQKAGVPGDIYSRVIAWTANQYLASPIYAPPQKCYVLHGFKLITGYPGRLLNFHQSPYGGLWNGVSPLAVDYFPGRGVEITAQAEGDGSDNTYHWTIFTQAEIEARRNQMVWGWMEIIWGKSDTTYDGSIKYWIAGEDTPRINVSNINMYHNLMTHCTLWEGAYISAPGAAVKCVIEAAATRVGRTPKECFEDKPILFQRRGAGTPAGTAIGIAPIEGGNVPIPAELRWL